MCEVCVFQYVVIPTRRSSALAVQILMCHALGDAGSPYIVGLVSTVFLLQTVQYTLVVHVA